MREPKGAQSETRLDHRSGQNVLPLRGSDRPDHLPDPDRRGIDRTLAASITFGAVIIDHATAGKRYWPPWRVD